MSTIRELWHQGIKKHGALKWWVSLLFFPILYPLWLIGQIVAIGMQKIGDYGVAFENWLLGDE